MIHEYRKKTTIKAEQFDGSKEINALLDKEFRWTYERCD